MDEKQPRRLIERFLRTRSRPTDDTSVSDPRRQRMDEEPSDSSTATPQPEPQSQSQPDTTTWADVGAGPVPKSGGSEPPVQLPESRAEPGGVPVYADPSMVTPAAAEEMRPLFRRER